MPTPTIAGPRHGSVLPGLQELRGVAIAMVVGFHMLTNVGWRQGAFAKAWFLTFGLGWTGVDLFFVLSGFLITGILLDTRREPRYLVNFYGRRILRVFPLYYLLLAAAAVLAGTRLGAGVNWQQLGQRSAAWYWCFLGNVPMVTGRGGDNSLNVAWSLAIEEQFYLAWPVIVLCLPRRPLGWLSAGLVAASPVARYAAQSRGMTPVACYFFTPCRLDGLAVGALLAVAYRSDRHWPWLVRRAWVIATAAGLALLALVAAVRQPLMQMSPGWPSVVSYSVVAACGASALLLVLGPARGRLRSRPLAMLGKYSFAIYLLHLPVFTAVLRLVAGRGGQGLSHRSALQDGVAAVAATAVTLGLAAASWRWVEAPCLSLKRQFQRWPGDAVPAGPAL